MVDADGVLVGGRPRDGRHWATDIEADLGLKLTDVQAEFFVPHWKKIVLGQADVMACLRPALGTLAPDISAETFLAYWLENDSRVDAVLLGDLDRLREEGMKIFLCTNQEHLRADYLLSERGLKRHIDGIFYSAAMGLKKPDVAFFKDSANRSGFAPDEIVLIDDSPANVSAAKQAGWNGIHWTGERSLADELAGMRI